MKPVSTTLIVLLLCLALAVPANAAPLSAIPTFSVISITPGASITLLTYNFPANQTFDVLMGEMHTRGVGGIRAGTVSSGTGGSFTTTVNIPAALRGFYQIAVRLQSQTKPEFFAYNWFYNDGSGPMIPDPAPGAPLPSGKPAPYFVVSGVARDISVTVNTYNFPLSHKFNVRMGPMGTRGVNGTLAQTVTTGNSASESFTFTIPAGLRGLPQIAIRLESANGTSGYYAYSWFLNDSYGSTGGVGPGPWVPGHPGGRVLPTFSITGVTRATNVSILAFNLPANKTFQVTMGSLGTRGIGGIPVASFQSGSGGSQAFTFSIPTGVAHLSEIAIRLQTVDGSGYYAYNWFFNNSTR